jgi:glutathione S-transferase
MFDPVVIGFARSIFVHIARLILTHKDVPNTFRDLEPEMAREWAVLHHPKY